MKLAGKTIALAALVTTALGTAVAVVPSYAQQGPQTDRAVRVEVERAMAGPRHHPGPQDMMAFVARAEALLERFDTDGDGAVTQEEIDAVRAEELASYDADGDGVLSLEEYQQLWLDRLYERMVDEFQHLDADGDGQITEEEFNVGLANIVERLDQNDDGALSADDGPVRGERPGGPAGAEEPDEDD